MSETEARGPEEHALGAAAACSSNSPHRERKSSMPRDEIGRDPAAIPIRRLAMLQQVAAREATRPARRDGPPKVLLILGHPRRGSLCEALADAYAAGAESAGVELRRLALTDFGFEQNVLMHSPRDQPL